MAARPDIHLYSFDMGGKDFSLPVAKFMCAALVLMQAMKIN